MKLPVNRVKVAPEATVVGSQAVIVRDDINGSVLVVQGGVDQIHVKLSDLVGFILQQEKDEGAKGDTEAE